MYFFDDTRILRRQGDLAALVADLLGSTLDHAVALACLAGLDLARGGELEALFRAALRPSSSTFASPSWRHARHLGGWFSRRACRNRPGRLVFGKRGFIRAIASNARAKGSLADRPDQAWSCSHMPQSRSWSCPARPRRRQFTKWATARMLTPVRVRMVSARRGTMWLAPMAIRAKPNRPDGKQFPATLDIAHTPAQGPAAKPALRGRAGPGASHGSGPRPRPVPAPAWVLQKPLPAGGGNAACR